MNNNSTTGNGVGAELDDILKLALSGIIQHPEVFRGAHQLLESSWYEGIKTALTNLIQEEKLKAVKSYQKLQHDELVQEVFRTDIEARIDELEHVSEPDEGVWLNFDPEINPITRKERLTTLKQLLNNKGGK